MTCYLYHICREGDQYDFSKGYVGISSNPSYRWVRHKKYENGDTILRRAYRKYQDIIEYVLLQGSREYCLMLERQLRPSKSLGWNMVAGGGDPPSQLGKVMPQEQRDKIGKAQEGSNGANWKGYWVVDGKRYESLNQAAKVYGVTNKTVRDRVINPKFVNWEFEPATRKGRR